MYTVRSLALLSELSQRSTLFVFTENSVLTVLSIGASCNLWQILLEFRPSSALDQAVTRSGVHFDLNSQKDTENQVWSIAWSCTLEFYPLIAWEKEIKFVKAFHVNGHVSQAALDNHGRSYRTSFPSPVLNEKVNGRISWRRNSVSSFVFQFNLLLI